MTDHPERIWLLPFDGEQVTWCDQPDPSGLGHEADATEYVRADVATPDVAGLLDALGELLQVQDGLPMSGIEASRRADIARAELAKWGR